MANGVIAAKQTLTDMISDRFNQFGIYYISCINGSRISIDKAAKVIPVPRQTLLCIYSDQAANSYLFRIFSGQDGNNPNIKFIYGSPTATISVGNGNIYIDGFGNWGQGFAIGITT